MKAVLPDAGGVPVSEFASGGIVSGSGPTALVALDDDECVLNREGMCVRGDVRHHRNLTEVHTWGSAKPIGHTAGPCRHRDCHRVPVESTVDGQIIAHLCRACDAQLP